MKKYLVRLVAVYVIGLAWNPGPAAAQGTTEERLQQVEVQVQELKRGEGQENPEGAEGGSGAISFHGYGELHFNHPVVEGSGFPVQGDRPTLDFHRLVFGWSYTFSDRLSLHSEIDFEHAAQELELEFAYMEYQFNDAVHVRVGSLLMPVGPLNEFHEPPLFYSVERPYVQRAIIPTTWQEGGVGLVGQLVTGLRYRIYLVEGLDASGFSAVNGIRGGRQVLFEDENKAFDFGGVGRLEYTGLPGFAAGASFYSAGAAQDDPVIDHAQVTLWEVDLRYRIAGIDFTGLYAHSHIGGADRISAVTGETIGSNQIGWYAELAYHLGQWLGSSWDLVPFARWEDFDTQSGIAALDRTPGTDRQVLTSGLAFYPHPDVAIKADWERWKDDTDETAARYNVGMAYQF
jgi:hypothetical protein